MWFLRFKIFFYLGVITPNLNSNVIVLIPKVHGACSMGDFRPIALANFQFKIVTKILAERLANIFLRIVFPHQRGFVCDRNISDCVIIASEVINLLPKKRFGGNVAIMVDIQKALWLIFIRLLIQWIGIFFFWLSYCFL